jgi:hypothetical protein
MPGTFQNNRRKSGSGSIKGSGRTAGPDPKITTSSTKLPFRKTALRPIRIISGKESLRRYPPKNTRSKQHAFSTACRLPAGSLKHENKNILFIQEDESVHHIDKTPITIMPDRNSSLKSCLFQQEFSEK